MADQLQTALAILRRRQVEREVGLGKSSIYARVKDGTFPAPIRLGPEGSRAVGWRRKDIDAFLADPSGFHAASEE